MAFAHLGHSPTCKSDEEETVNVDGRWQWRQAAAARRTTRNDGLVLVGCSEKRSKIMTGPLRELSFNLRVWMNEMNDAAGYSTETHSTVLLQSENEFSVCVIVWNSWYSLHIPLLQYTPHSCFFFFFFFLLSTPRLFFFSSGRIYFRIYIYLDGIIISNPTAYTSFCDAVFCFQRTKEWSVSACMSTGRMDTMKQVR